LSSRSAGNHYRPLGRIRSAAGRWRAQLKIYKEGSHGICTVQKDEVNADLLSFIQAKSGDRAVAAYPRKRRSGRQESMPYPSVRNREARLTQSLPLSNTFSSGSVVLRRIH
jgi:hypothetical protein